MGRIRTIKPEFPQSESIGSLSRDARLLFIQLFTLADDEGRLRGASRMLASLLYPYDEDVPALIGDWLEELEDKGHIARYSVGEHSYVQIHKFLEHQKIDRPSKSKLPPFAKPREESTKDHEPSPPYQVSSIKDQGRDSARDAQPPTPAPQPVHDFNADPEDNVPDGLAITQYAGFVCDFAHIPAKYGLKVHFGDAITMLAEMESCTIAVATKRMLDRVRAASPGTKWSFWLQDGGWKKEAIDGANKPSAAKQRVDGNRRAIAEALAKRGVSGPWDAFRKDGATVPESGSVEHAGGVHGGLGSVSPEVLPPVGRGRGGNIAR